MNNFIPFGGIKTINKIQTMNIVTFKEITPAAVEGILDSLAYMSKLDTGIFESQKNLANIMSVFDGIKENIVQLNGIVTIGSLQGVTEVVSALSDVLKFNSFNVKIDGIADSIKGLQNVFGNNIEKWNSINDVVKIWNQKLQPIVESIPDEEYELLLQGTDYTKDNVVEDFNIIVEETKEEDNDFQQIFSDDTLNPKEKIEKIVNEIYKRSHAVCYVVLIVVVLLTVHNCKDALQNTYIPLVESIFGALEDNQDKYFVKEECVKVYESSSCQSKVLDIIYYGEEVEELKDIKMWLEVSYVNEDGTECIGWIAKRNLMTYQDWKYNSDDLYNVK